MTSIAPEAVTDDELETPPVADIATDGGDEPDVVALDDDEDEDEDLQDEPAPEADESAEATDTPAATAATEDPAQSASTQAEPESAPEPVVIEYEGGTYTIPHAFFDHKTNSLRFDDVRGAQRAHTLMRLGVWAEAEGRKQIETLEVRLQKEVEAARTDAKEFFDALMGSAELPEPEFIERMLQFRAQAPELRHQMTVAQYERRIAEMEGRKQGAAFRDVPEIHLSEWAEAQTSQRVQQDFASKEYPWMTDKAAAHLARAMSSPAARKEYVRTATEADVQADPRLAIGQPVIDWGAWNRVSGIHAEAWKEAYAAEQAAKANAAKTVQTLGKTAQQNSKILAHAKPAGKAAPVAATVAPPREKTRADMEAEIARARAELQSATARNPRRNLVTGQFI